MNEKQEFLNAKINSIEELVNKIVVFLKDNEKDQPENELLVQGFNALKSGIGNVIDSFSKIHGDLNGVNKKITEFTENSKSINTLDSFIDEVKPLITNINLLQNETKSISEKFDSVFALLKVLPTNSNLNDDKAELSEPALLKENFLALEKKLDEINLLIKTNEKNADSPVQKELFDSVNLAKNLIQLKKKFVIFKTA